ncbi:MAG: hypothetical protein K0V04_15035 [Deltaproteobacteria bacterium]|nr:hypothetical protein [Deltaproteobacteria bacterium]
MNTKPKKHTLVLVAAGLLTTTAGLTSTPAQAQESCQIPDPENNPGGEVSMSLEQLGQAKQLPNGGWWLHVEASDLAGVEVPKELKKVELHLTNQQMKTAVDVAKAANSKTVVFAVHSEEWAAKMEQRLLGGFSVNFNVSVCEYSAPWT